MKTLVVLANSVKHGKHCIAGRELMCSKEGGSYDTLRGWVRPVSSHGEGELSSQNCQFQSGAQPQILDMIQVPIKDASPSYYQPENYLIDEQYYWERLKSVTNPKSIRRLIEHPSDLWLESAYSPEFVTEGFLHSSPPPQSLYLVQPDNLTFKLWVLYISEEDRYKKRLKACFNYNGVRYELAVTDPAMWEFFKDSFPEAGEADKVVRLPNHDEYYLCISLGTPFRGRHYKLVASVIDPTFSL